MNKSGFTMDFTDFNKKSNRIIEHTIPDATRRGVREAAQEWKLDADNVPPRTPHKEGHLRASGRVSKAEVRGQEITAEVSYDAPYARRWHEVEPGTIKWSEPGVGPKYLESKAVRFAKKYLAIVAAVIRRAK